MITGLGGMLELPSRNTSKVLAGNESPSNAVTIRPSQAWA